MNNPTPISELSPDGVNVLLMRRTGNDTVKAAVGCMWPGGKFKGWYNARPPTHFCALPPLSSRSKS